MKQTGENRAPSPVGVGALSVMTALLAVTLSVFAVLTLASARADFSLSERAAQAVSAFYAADAQAQQLFSEFEQGGESTLEAEVPVDENRTLCIAAQRGPDGRAQVTQWTVRTAQTQQQDSLPVYQGE